MEWKEAMTRDQSLPEPRVHHSSVIVGNSLFVHGGRGIGLSIEDLLIFVVNEMSGIHRKISQDFVAFRIGGSMLELLPIDILGEILRRLDLQSIVAVAATCKSLRQEVNKR
jgi:hypothetical protein